MFEHRLTPTPYTQSPELTRALETLKVKRGNAKDWLNKEIAIMHFITELDSTSKRIFSRGEVQFTDRHLPAVLIYDVITDKVEAWAQSGESDTFEAHTPMFFHCNVAHASHVREALMHETAVTV